MASPAESTSPGFLIGLAVVALAGAGLIISHGPARAQGSISYDFDQSQSQLSVTVRSSSEITASQWSYAGPLDTTDNCSNRQFPGIPAQLKGKAAVTKSTDRIGQAKISISRADNNKYYCFIIEGYPTARKIDYNPPVIEHHQDEGNRLGAKDTPQGSYSSPGTVNGSSWQAAFFDIAQAGPNYDCSGANSQLKFGAVSGSLKYVGQWSWGNTNYLAYNVPNRAAEAIEFFDGLKAAVDWQQPADPALVPFVDDQFSPQFNDNIHLCHRVDDNQGNTAYKLMRLDLGGPAIKLELDGKTIRASSPAVDLDQSSWQYLSTDQRLIKTTCELIDSFPEPTGLSNLVDRASAGNYYCFLVADQRGNIGHRWIKADSGAAKPSATEPETTDPTPTTTAPEPETTNTAQSQLTESNRLDPQAGPEAIDGQAAEPVDQAVPADAEPEPANNPVADNPDPASDDETTTVDTTDQPGSQTEGSSRQLWLAISIFVGLAVTALAVILARKRGEQAKPAE